MNTIPDNIRVGVYDLYDMLDNYWQWTTHPVDERWEAAARQVQKGWQSKLHPFSDQQAVLWGIHDTGGETFWAYRLYPAGRDRFGREGRCFFVLLELSSPDQLLSTFVAGVMRHFETERGLPLDVKPLNAFPRTTQPAAGQNALRKLVGNRERKGHWGMDGHGDVMQFAPPPQAAASPPVVTVPPVASAPAGAPQTATAATSEPPPAPPAPSPASGGDQPSRTRGTNGPSGPSLGDVISHWSWRKLMVVVLGLWLVGFMLRQSGYREGLDTGWNRGLEAGKMVGYEDGYKVGRDSVQRARPAPPQQGQTQPQPRDEPGLPTRIWRWLTQWLPD